jgi:hypothetical protein
MSDNNLLIKGSLGLPRFADPDEGKQIVRQFQTAEAGWTIKA